MSWTRRGEPRRAGRSLVAERTVAWSWAGAAFAAPMNGPRVAGFLTLSDVLLTLAVAASVVAGRRAGNRGRFRLDGPVDGPVLAGVAAIAGGGLVGTMVAGPNGPDLAGIARFLFATAGSVGAMALWRPSRRQLRWFGAMWVAGAAASSLWALAFSTTMAGRPLGLASHPNNLGLACLLGLGPALGVALGAPRMGRRAAVGVAGALLLGLLASGSRAALIGACVVVPTVAALSSHRRLALRTATAAGLLCMAVAVGVVRPPPDTNLGRVLGDRSTVESDADRIEYLARSVDRVRSHPLTGEGFDRAGQAHNIYLQALVAAGPLGLLGLLVVAGSVMAAGLRAIPRCLSGEDRALLAGLTAGYAGYLVASCFQNNLSERYLWLYVAALLTLAARSGRQAVAVRPADHLPAMEDQRC